MEDTKDQKRSPTYERATGAELVGEGYNSSSRGRTSLNRLRQRKFLVFTIGLLFIIFVTLGTLALFYTQDQQRILEGVTISGLKVGNLTKDEAKEIVDSKVITLLGQTVKLKVGQQPPELKLKELGLGLNSDQVLQEAYDIGRKGSIYERILFKISTRKELNIDFTQQWNETKLRETLKDSLSEFSKPSTDASFQISKDNIMTIKSEYVGLVIDSEALIKKVTEISIYKPIPDIEVEFKEQIPLVTAAILEDQKITGLLASYTTRFDPTQTARSENLRIAAKAMDMAVIKPNEILSFNKIVGERTVEGGYKDAFIIVNGEFVPGLAGGICQVSSTLYNTGLLANLAVTQRSNHDLAVSYVPLGQDATVAYPDLDLKFNNNSGGFLLLRTKMSYNTITIEIYGKVKPGQEVLIENTIESTIPAVEQRLVDETMAQGVSVLKRQGQPGYSVKSSRTVKMNGVIVSIEPLKPSRYAPLPKVYSVGP